MSSTCVRCKQSCPSPAGNLHLRKGKVRFEELPHFHVFDDTNESIGPNPSIRTSAVSCSCPSCCGFRSWLFLICSYQGKWAPRRCSQTEGTRVGAIIVARISVFGGRAVDCHLHPHIMFETRVHNNFYLLRCDRLRNMELDSCGTPYAYRKQQPSLLRLEQCYSNCGCSNVNPHNTAPKPRTMVDHSLVARMMEQCTTRRQGEAGVLAPPLRP